MTDAATIDHDDDEERGIWRRLELIAAIILGVAGVLTAYAAYQGALADGDSLDKYTESAKLTADANGWYSDAKQQFGQDLALFTQFQILVEEGTQDTADVIKDNLFSPALLTAYDAWLEIPEGEGPPTPLDMDEYVLDEFTEGDAATAAAEEAFADAQKANDDGDKFELAAVFLAVALFLAGIATLFKVRGVRLGLLVGAVILIVPGVIAILAGHGSI